MTEHLTICRLCVAFCGMVVDVDGDRVVRVRGDAGHPLSRAYLCPKGRSLPAFHHHPDRLDQPTIGGVATDWDAMLSDLAQRLRAIVDEHGPTAVAYYTASGSTHDTAGRAATTSFFRELGARRLSAATVDVAPAWRAAQLVLGTEFEIRPEWFPDDRAPRVAILVGINPVVSHGYIGLILPDPIRWLREYRAGGGQLWVVDPRRTETAQLADHHLAVAPGTDAIVLAFLARELLAAGADHDELAWYTDPADVERLRRALRPFTANFAARRTGLPEQQLTGMLDAIRDAGKIALTLGTGITFSPHALVTEWLAWVLGIITGSIDRPGGMWANAGWYDKLEERDDWKHTSLSHEPPAPASRPDLPMWFGEIPVVALPDEIRAGNIKALFVTGGSPLTAFPDPERTSAALRSLDALVVVDVLANELTAMATHVLPAAGLLERPDMPGPWLHHMSYSPAIVPVGADRRPTWWMIVQLARRLGVSVFDTLDPDTATGDDVLDVLGSHARRPTEELAAAGPRGVEIPRTFGWVHERALPDGRWRLAPPLVVDRLSDLLDEPASGHLSLVSGRNMRRHNVVAYGQRSADEAAAVHLNPDDARDAALADGDPVELASADGLVVGRARVDERLRRGDVHLSHAQPAANVAHLTSATVDAMTGQPVMTAIPVTVTALAPGRRVHPQDNKLCDDS